MGLVPHIAWRSGNFTNIAAVRCTMLCDASIRYITEYTMHRVHYNYYVH